MDETRAPAFPGAEGHGRYLTGGRGGKIVHVTNLNDKGEGSLRQAVSGNDPKIIVFDVAGVIALASDLTIGENTTIEGQTAPYPGITLRYRTIRPGANNIIRFIRGRRGQEKDVNDGADAIWQRQKNGILLDHCSFSWSIDEVASFYDNNNFTMQWCTISESLNNAGHGKGAHGYGGIWGGKLASFHHNLVAHVNNRAPRFNGARYEWGGYTKNSEYETYQWENYVQAEIVDFRNCVMFNWGSGNGCYGGPGGGYINIVNNYYKAGPSTTNKTRVTQISVNTADNSTSTTLNGMTSRYFIEGNYVTAAGENAANYDWQGVIYDGGVFTIDGERYSKDPNHFYGSQVEYKKNTSGVDCVRIKLDEAVPAGKVTTHTAETAFEKVLDYAGASFWRDNVDERYAIEARTGEVTYSGSVTKKKGMIDIVADVNGYTEADFGTGSRPENWDTDGDGMPDYWEIANGLDPNNPEDANLYTLDKHEFYTNIEVYCNSLVEDIMKAGNEDAETTFNEYYPRIKMAAKKEQ
ncbi:MAG: pectate lyase [Prevotella sp.]|nr:pectate lyase [Prevotella sp.]